MGNKILITGTAGFIGFHLTQKLIKAREWNIVGIDNINDYYDVNLKYARLRETGIKEDQIEYNKIVSSYKSNNYRFIQLNLIDRKNIFKLFETEKFDYVVNLAAQAGVRYSIENPYAYIDSNIYGFLNILESCRLYSVNRLLYASSSSVYGANTKVPFSEDDNVDYPISLYAATKKANELMAYTYSHLYRLPTIGLRFFTVYGPWGRPDMAAFIFTKAILEDKPIKVYNYGKMERDFTYIDDIIYGINGLLNKSHDEIFNKKLKTNAPYLVINIGNHKPENLEYFIGLLEKYLKKKAIKEYLPLQAGDVIKTYADNSKLQRIISSVPYTKLDEGIKNFIEWYNKYYGVLNDN